MLIFTCSQYGSSPILNLFLTKSMMNNAVQYIPNSKQRILLLLMLLYFLLWHTSFYTIIDFDSVIQSVDNIYCLFGCEYNIISVFFLNVSIVFCNSLIVNYRKCFLAGFGFLL